MVMVLVTILVHSIVSNPGGTESPMVNTDVRNFSVPEVELDMPNRNASKPSSSLLVPTTSSELK